jgi:hypothetical protein
MNLMKVRSEASPVDQSAGAALQKGTAEHADVVAGAVAGVRIIAELFRTVKVDGVRAAGAHTCLDLTVGPTCNMQMRLFLDFCN